MSSGARYPVLPSRMSMLLFKVRIKGAQTGHKMLKKKADALTLRHRMIMGELRKIKTAMVQDMKQAHFSLSEAQFTAGDTSFAVQESLKLSTLKAVLKLDNIAGVIVVAMTTNATTRRDKDLAGLGRGGEQIKAAREAFQKVLAELIAIASSQTTFNSIDAALKVTNRRVNALEKVVIPKMERTLAYVATELDELEKEEFFRLKMVQKKKKILKDHNEEIRRAKMEAQEKAELAALKPGTSAPAVRATPVVVPDILGGLDDEIVV